MEAEQGLIEHMARSWRTERRVPFKINGRVKRSGSKYIDWGRTEEEEEEEEEGEVSSSSCHLLLDTIELLLA